MFFLQAKQFSWKDLLLGGEEWQFLPEVMIRTVVMFAIVLISMVVLGKRGVRQLSVFELVVIIGLGSAAGDPMFYKDVGLIPALIVFTIVISLYSLVTYLVGRSKRMEHLVEGKPICLVEHGVFALANFAKQNLGQDEFFAELRVKGVSHLGQVETALIETNGEISIFFYEDAEVLHGLPIMPGSLDSQEEQITQAGMYSCTFCGYTKKLQASLTHVCPACERSKWVKSSDKRRVS